jgi:hypothetical protein
MIVFSRRGRRYETEVARFRRWNSDDGRYSIVETRSKFGLNTRFIAIVRLKNSEVIIARARTLAGAKRACQRHEKKRPPAAVQTRGASRRKAKTRRKKDENDS